MVVSKSASVSHEAWQTQDHITRFDKWAALSTKQLRKTFESFNEIQLLNQYLSQIRQPEFVEIGCATGELYRYLRNYHPEIQYHGYDISKPAIERAQEKYPPSRFSLCGEKMSENRKDYGSPSVLFSRDVVPHQTDPFGFMAKMISLPTEAAFLRIRTRDNGETELNTELSCMWTYEKWVPYMVMNINEVIDCIRTTREFSTLHIIKRYRQLGGYNSRYLPKDCYLPETGTAETAIYINFTSNDFADPKIIIEDRAEPDVVLNVLDRAFLRAKKAYS